MPARARRTPLAAAAAALLLAALPAPAQSPPSVPYTLAWEEVSIPGLPGLQSFAWAQSGGKWLLLAGRRSGLHGFDNPPKNNFPPDQANDSIYVVDPAAGRVWSASVGTLPDSVADALRVTNPQHEQAGDALYVVGGYGMNSSTKRMMTFPTLLSIRVGALMDAVMNRRPIAPHIRIGTDWRLAVTGGELRRLGGYYWLVFGQQFDGLYSPNNADSLKWFTQVYTEQIARFTIDDTGPAPRVGTWFTPFRSTAPDRPYHRRDLTVAPIMRPIRVPGLGIYGGVFAPGNDSAYRKPVYVASAASQPRVDGYLQSMSQYSAANLPAFSERTGSMYTTFFGGISLYQVNRATTPASLVLNDTIPFVDAVTTLVRAAGGATFECILPTALPGLLGADAAFLEADGAPFYDNGVVRLDRVSGPTMVGWVYGGILAQQPNFGASTASSRVFRVTLTPGQATQCLAATTPSAATTRERPQRGRIRRRP